MADFLTIGEITAELVARGIPRYDGEPGDRDWHGPMPSWWIHHPEPGPNVPKSYLNLIGESDGNEWQLSVASCACCDAVLRTELIGIHGETFSYIALWPGLDAAIRFHRHATELLEADLERIAKEAEADG
jgi:hypothetical protein